MNWFEGREKLQKAGISLFTAQDVRRLGEISPAAAKFFLLRGVRRGWLVQLKRRRGLYGFAGRPPHPFALAARLYRPSYVSLESALVHHGLLPEAVYAVTSLTPRASRSFEAGGLRFQFQHIKPSAFTGYRPVVLDGETAWLASPEKAAADYFYFVHLGRKPFNERIRWRKLNRRAVDNLILNALKFTPRGGAVEGRWGPRQGRLQMQCISRACNRPVIDR